MMHELSPAVERAAVAARALAKDGTVTFVHWFLGLLIEEEGRPAALLERLGVSLEHVRSLAENAIPNSVEAPAESTLFELARSRSLSLGGEATFTTDFLLLTVLAEDHGLQEALAPVSLTVRRIEQALRSSNVVEEMQDFDGASFTITDSEDHIEAARVVDANLNRSREALRVLDDYARFVLNDAFLTEQFKKLRHELAASANSLPAGLLLSSRDTRHDVGTELTAGAEYLRHSPRSVAHINLKRLQEALRSLEEFGKILSADFARGVERLRYESYTFEKALLRGGGSVRERLAKAKLYLLLTGALCEAAVDWTIQQAALGGVDVFQMREKALCDQELLERARRQREWTLKAEALFIVNDRPDMAMLSDADGVHLGQDDMPVSAARKIVGPDRIIGVSTHDLAQLRQAILDGADYVGIGPVFPSKTKAFDHFPGLEFVRAASAETSLPAFALGGIHLGNVAQVRSAGCARIAVSSAIAQVDDPRAAAQALRAALEMS